MNIFLNGTSSAGKTTIAKLLQNRLGNQYIICARDIFHQMLPPEFWQDKKLRQQQGPAFFRGFHRSIAAFNNAGVPVIIDHVLNQQDWVAECAHILAGFPTLFVGVKCPLEVIEERERKRPDRKPGLARSQYNLVHSHGIYDLTVDTSVQKPTECADIILAQFKQGDFSAFNQFL